MNNRENTDALLERARCVQRENLSAMRPFCSAALLSAEHHTAVRRERRVIPRALSLYLKLAPRPLAWVLSAALVACVIGAALVITRLGAESIAIQFQQLGYSEYYLFALDTLEQDYNLVAPNLGIGAALF